MFIYFEDWSEFTHMLDQKGIAHGGKIIKVYTSTRDPREVHGRQDLAFFEIDDTPLREEEVFSYGERENFTGRDIEDYLATLELTPEVIQRMRALFRFANQSDTQFTREGMSLKNQDGGWLINHPIEEIDGLSHARRNPEKMGMLVHLDVFVPASTERLLRLIGYSSEEGKVHPERLVGGREKRSVGRRVET